MGRPHGLKGGFFVSGRDEPIPRRFREVQIGETTESARPAVVQWSGTQGARPLMVCSLASDRTGAEALTGLGIFVERLALHSALPPDAWLWDELIGLSVIDAAGVAMGKVLHVYNAGASDILEIIDEHERILDVALVSNYVDMERGLSRSEQSLRLAVLKEVFAELWQKPRV